MIDGYVYKQTAINAICQDWCNRDYCGDCFFHGAKQAIDVLKALPDADVQQVIRCKDCIHAEHWYRDKSRCFLWHEEGIDVFEDGFCNYGERKKGEQNG